MAFDDTAVSWLTTLAVVPVFDALAPTDVIVDCIRWLSIDIPVSMIEFKLYANGNCDLNGIGAKNGFGA